MKRAADPDDSLEDFEALPPSDGEADEPDGPHEEAVDLVDDEEAPDSDDSYADNLEIGDPELLDDDAEDSGDEHGLDHEDDANDDDLEPQRTAGPSAGPDADDSADLDTGDHEELPELGEDIGAEGLDEEEPPLEESALPALDEGQGDEMDLDSLLTDLGMGAAQRQEWEARQLRHASKSLACVHANGSHVVAAGESLLVGEGTRDHLRESPLAEPALAVAVGETKILLATRRGLYCVDLNAKIQWFSPQTNASQVAIAADRLFALRGDELLTCDAQSCTVLLGGVAGIAAEAASLYVHRQDGTLLRSKGHDDALADLPLEPSLQESLRRGGKLLVSPHGSLGVTSLARAVILFRQPDKLATDKLATDKVTTDKMTTDKVTTDKVTTDKVVAINLGESIVAATFGQLAGQEAMFAAIEGGLVCAITADGKRHDLLLLGENQATGAIAWDAARDALLVVGANGLGLYGPLQRH